MDPVTLAVFFFQHQSQIEATVKSAATPGVVDVAKMQASLADMSQAILKCYHKTAHFKTVDVLQRPWARQGQYAAENSAMVGIRYVGVTEARYTMQVAVMIRQGKVRTVVTSDTALIPYSKKCQLEEWTGL